MFSSKSEYKPSLSSSAFHVQVIRNGIIESIHKVHAVVCDSQGKTLMHLGDYTYQSFIRSALKPFQSIPFITTGLINENTYTREHLAIACASHDGTPIQVRSVLALLKQADISTSLLQCPTPTGRTSPLEHNCSGKHASFLVTCKYMNWELETYLNRNHPLQQVIYKYICNLLGVNERELIIACDDCGAPTLNLPLCDIAHLYAHLNNFSQREIQILSKAMIEYPLMVAGNGRFDTELMRRGFNQVLSKGGAEGIQCISHLREGIGIAIKVEDGSRRAKQAAAIHILKKLQWLGKRELEILEEQFLIINKNVVLTVREA
ncbi:MAG TPA: asparaginase [Prochlorococcaceae cyanobacterium AMR_MDS_5431]|nr:asparaginase [Prochlorococcaceae cyanobacterium AMR_MDS_5431]